jgi:hexokinase
MADEPERGGDLSDEITRELQRLFPAERMQRIIDRLGLEGTDEDVEYLADLISAIFTRGIEFGAVEVTAQEIEAGRQMQSEINIAHVDLP